MYIINISLNKYLQPGTSNGKLNAAFRNIYLCNCTYNACNLLYNSLNNSSKAVFINESKMEFSSSCFIIMSI